MVEGCFYSYMLLNLCCDTYILFIFLTRLNQRHFNELIECSQISNHLIQHLFLPQKKYQALRENHKRKTLHECANFILSLFSWLQEPLALLNKPLISWCFKGDRSCVPPVWLIIRVTWGWGWTTQDHCEAHDTEKANVKHEGLTPITVQKWPAHWRFESNKLC